MRLTLISLVRSIRRAPGAVFLTVLIIATLGVLNPLACLLHCAALHQAHMHATSVVSVNHSEHMHGEHSMAGGQHQHMADHGLYEHTAAPVVPPERTDMLVIGCMSEHTHGSDRPRPFYELLPVDRVDIAAPVLQAHSLPTGASCLHTWIAPPPAPPPRLLA